MASQVVERYFSSEFLMLIGDIGLLASYCNLHDKAESIYSRLSQARPESPFPLICLAMVRARSGRVKEAVEQLKSIVEKFPENDLAKAFLGVYMIESKQKGVLKIFDQILASGKDTAAINLVNCFMEMARDLEKTQSDTEISSTLEVFRHHNFIRP